jgi:hypothetical protein
MYIQYDIPLLTVIRYQHILLYFVFKPISEFPNCDIYSTVLVSRAFKSLAVVLQVFL